MKFILQVVVIAVLAHILELYLPWYYIVVAAFIGGYALKSKANFLAGFCAIALLWAVNAWWINTGGSTDLAERVANILMLKHTVLLYIFTAFIGGLVGGFGALSGALLKRGGREFRK
jgi:hypothetical protein